MIIFHHEYTVDMSSYLWGWGVKKDNMAGTRGGRGVFLVGSKYNEVKYAYVDSFFTRTR